MLSNIYLPTLLVVINSQTCIHKSVFLIVISPTMQIYIFAIYGIALCAVYFLPPTERKPSDRKKIEKIILSYIAF